MSSIPRIGLGLFTTKHLAKGTHKGYYNGRTKMVTDGGEYVLRDGTAL